MDETLNPEFFATRRSLIAAISARRTSSPHRTKALQLLSRVDKPLVAVPAGLRCSYFPVIRLETGVRHAAKVRVDNTGGNFRPLPITVGESEWIVSQLWRVGSERFAEVMDEACPRHIGVVDVAPIEDEIEIVFGVLSAIKRVTHEQARALRGPWVAPTQHQSYDKAYMGTVRRLTDAITEFNRFDRSNVPISPPTRMPLLERQLG